MFSFRWLRNKTEYDLALLDHLENIRSIDGWIGKLKSFPGYCNICNVPANFQVFGGALFGNTPNLREGMVCSNCGLSNRQRLVMGVAQNIWCQPDVVLLLQERFTTLYQALARRYPKLDFCEYLGRDVPRGNMGNVHGVRIRNEDATALTFADESFDGVVHNDVLEHIPHFRRALREWYRVLKQNGTLLFTCPFFARRSEHLIRAKVDESGHIEYLEPPEWHGDPLNDQGILAYYHFGWRLLDDLESSGFANVAVGIAYEPLLGLTTNRFPDDYGLMMPIVFRAVKR